jgi:PAS domain-containing protein
MPSSRTARRCGLRSTVFRRADGAYSTVVDRAYVVRDAGGEPVRMIGSMMDVTERKRDGARRQGEREEIQATL